MSDNIEIRTYHLKIRVGRVGHLVLVARYAEELSFTINLLMEKRRQKPHLDGQTKKISFSNFGILWLVTVQ